jgi:protein-disulfide isomerase
VVEFGDYECPFCAAAAPEVERFLATHATQVRFVYRHWPLAGHKFAKPAARAAECANAQGRFWEMHHQLYASHDSLGLIPFSEIAKRAGVVDLDRFAVCARDTTPLPAIDAGRGDARQAGAMGTPTLFVNGLRLSTGLDTALIGRLIAAANAKH